MKKKRRHGVIKHFLRLVAINHFDVSPTVSDLARAAFEKMPEHYKRLGFGAKMRDLRVGQRTGLPPRPRIVVTTAPPAESGAVDPITVDDHRCAR